MCLSPLALRAPPGCPVICILATDRFEIVTGLWRKSRHDTLALRWIALISGQQHPMGAANRLQPPRATTCVVPTTGWLGRRQEARKHGVDGADFQRHLQCAPQPGALRDCLIRSCGCKTTEHQARHGDIDHGFTTGGQHFIVLAQAPALRQPGEGPLHHPAPGEDNKAFLIVRAQHRL